MHRKGSMELSVNSIVILVIAVVMMGLILGFIRSKFSEIGGGFIVDESPAPEATASNPITMSRNLVTVSGTKKTGLNVNFYNTHTADVTQSVPHFHCKSTTAGNPVIVGEYFSKTTERSKMAEFSGNIKLQASVPKDTYLCTVCFSRVNAHSAATTCNTIQNNNQLIAIKEFQLIVQ